MVQEGSSCNILYTPMKQIFQENFMLIGCFVLQGQDLDLVKFAVTQSTIHKMLEKLEILIA